jgi:hypothetical protein
VAPGWGSVTGQAVPGARKDGVGVVCGDAGDGGAEEEQPEPSTAARQPILTTTARRRPCDTDQA